MDQMGGSASPTATVVSTSLVPFVVSAYALLPLSRATITGAAGVAVAAPPAEVVAAGHRETTGRQICCWLQLQVLAQYVSGAVHGLTTTTVREADTE